MDHLEFAVIPEEPSKRGLPVTLGSNGVEDIRHSGTAFLYTVMVVQAQVQDQGRIIENILLVPSLSINR